MRIELEDALALIQEYTVPVAESELCALSALCGRVAAAAVAAPMDLPPFDRSPVDGFAFNHQDTSGATPGHPVQLRISATLYAGDFPDRDLERGCAVRIMTGAPIPPGADCVLRQEEATVEGDALRVSQSLRRHDNYCFRAEDVAKGHTILRAGDRAGFAHIGVLAGLGVGQAAVYRQARVLVLTTGDELCPLGAPLAPGKIYNSNLHMLCARLRELGAETIPMAICADDCQAIGTAVRDLIGGADLLITTGGVSVGQKDYMKQALSEMGARILFHGLNLKPGTPALFALYQGKPVLALSGNPFAAATTFELLGRPLLAAFCRDQSLWFGRSSAVLTMPFPKGSETRRFVRALLKDGQVSLPAQNQHSPGALASMLDCNCLIDIPAGSAGLPAGSRVELILL